MFNRALLHITFKVSYDEIISEFRIYFDDTTGHYAISITIDNDEIIMNEFDNRDDFYSFLTTGFIPMNELAMYLYHNKYITHLPDTYDDFKVYDLDIDVSTDDLINLLSNQ